MNRKAFWIGLVLIVTLTASGTILHGRLSNRWGPSQSMIEAGARLQHIPDGVEMWELQSTEPLPDYARAMLECAGDLSRTYVNPTTKASVSFALIMGPVGPTSVHSPEICFPARNYELLGTRKRVKIRDSAGIDHEFWAVDFRSQGLEARLLHVYYAWSTGGPWSAPDNPRFEYARSPYLYKLQLTGYPSPIEIKESDDPVPDFLSVFLPAAKTEIVSASLTR